LAVQFHPEFKSKPTAAHPLFSGFTAAAIVRHQLRGEQRSKPADRDVPAGPSPTVPR